MPKKKDDIVRLTLDPHNLPALTEEQKARLDAIAAMPYENIDYSDAPSIPNPIWKKAVAVPPTKKQITLRIDADVIDFFQHTGRRYQTRINAVLRSYVEAARHAAN